MVQLDSIIGLNSLIAKGVYGFFPARSENERIDILNDDISFEFPRQMIDKGNSLNYCLADYVSADGSDFLGMFTVTAGHGGQAQQ